MFRLQNSLLALCRAAKSVGIKGLDPTIAKDLNNSEDPIHTLFCRKIAFVAMHRCTRFLGEIFSAIGGYDVTAIESLEYICY